MLFHNNAVVISDFRINTHQLKNLQSDFNPKFIEKKSPSSQDKKSRYGRVQKELLNSQAKSPKSPTILTGYFRLSPIRPKHVNRFVTETIAESLVKKNREIIKQNSPANNNNNEMEDDENHIRQFFEEIDAKDSQILVKVEPEQKKEFFSDAPLDENMLLSEKPVKEEKEADIFPHLEENTKALEPSAKDLEIKAEFFHDPLLDDLKEVQNENSSPKSLDEQVDLDESLESPDFEIHDPSIIECLENVTGEHDQQLELSNKQEAPPADDVHIETKSQTELEPLYQENISEDNTGILNRNDFESQVDGKSAMDLENVTDKSSGTEIIFLVNDDPSEFEQATGCSRLFVDTEIISQLDDECSINLEKVSLVEKIPECFDESSIVFEMVCDDKPSIELNTDLEVKADDITDLSNESSIEVDMMSNENEKASMNFLNISEKNKSPGSKDSGNGSTIDTEIVSVKKGELFWAQIGTYPYWPCIISPDPDKKTISYTEKSVSKSHIIHHVRFFADNGRRSWVREDKLLPYNGRESFVQKYSDLPRDPKNYKLIKLYKKTVNNKTWDLAIAEADSLRPYSLKERGQKFETILEISR